MDESDFGPTGSGPHPDNVGVIVLSPQGRVWSANRQGLETSRRLGCLSQGRLHFFDPNSEQYLQDALGRHKREQVLRLLPQEGAPVFAFLLDGRRAPLWRAGPPANLPTSTYALVFPAHDNGERLTEALRASFGLTNAEARLALKLRDGLTLSEAAQYLGVRLNTVRAHLRAIFEKIGVSRQSHLIRALSEIAVLSSQPIAASMNIGPVWRMAPANAVSKDSAVSQRTAGRPMALAMDTQSIFGSPRSSSLAADGPAAPAPVRPSSMPRIR